MKGGDFQLNCVMWLFRCIASNPTCNGRNTHDGDEVHAGNRIPEGGH